MLALALVLALALALVGLVLVEGQVLVLVLMEGQMQQRVTKVGTRVKGQCSSTGGWLAGERATT